MKVLILSCSTGGGHNAAGIALKEQFEKQGIFCELRDMHSLIEKKRTKQAAALYSFVAVNMSTLFGAVYKLAGWISHPSGRSPVYLFNLKYAKPIREYMKAGGFDTVICTHLFPAEALTRIRRTCDDSFTFYFVATDYTCSPFNEETKPDYYFIPHKDIADEYRGISPDRRIALGIPCQEKFASHPSAHEKEQAKGLLGLSLHKKQALIMCGSMGFGRIEMVLHHIMNQMGDAFEYTVLVGHNEKLKARLDRLFGNQVHTVPFTEQADLYMRAADIVFTKPGGLSSTEAAALGIPLVHTKPIPGCETKNARFFSERGMSVLYKNSKDIQRVLDLIADSSHRQTMINKQRQYINPHASKDICTFVQTHSKRA
ncbi:MAG: glycosyl transferase [Clostridiales bacterium]|nr:glycosyl transferase [Clostridiales bacterium]